MIAKWKHVTAVVTLVHCSAPFGLAQTPIDAAFTYQGQLKELGQPATGTYAMQFKLYASDLGGTPLATDPPSGTMPVTVQNGLFTAVVDFGTAAFNGEQRWLEVVVEGTTLTPRQELTATSYAWWAAAPWTSGTGGTLSYTGGNVGIGTSTPAASLEVVTAGAQAVSASHIPTSSQGQLGGSLAGVSGFAGTTAYGVYGLASAVGSSGVHGRQYYANGNGVMGQSDNGNGVFGISTTATGVLGYSQTAGTIGRLGTPQYGVYGENAGGYAGYFAGDVHVTGDLTVDGNLDVNVWGLTGNAGTIPGTNFLGTTDNQPLIVKVNGQQALRVEPTWMTPNLVGGYSGNAVTPGVVGATLAGGGRPDDGVGNPDDNYVSADFGTISGGEGNRVYAGAATVGGGADNTADNVYATIGGGYGNWVAGDYGTVSGGYNNDATANYATVGGGFSNTATGDWGTVGGGDHNDATGSSSTVGGGYDNTASGTYSTIGGGYVNIVSGYMATVGGGSSNEASGEYAAIGGGIDNTANGTYYSAVGGGFSNQASGYSATVGGGYDCTASGTGATVPGGYGNQAGGYYSFAAGLSAKVRDSSLTGDYNGDEGTFVWADSTVTDFQSTGPNQFLIRAAGGVGIGTTTPGRALHVNHTTGVLIGTSETSGGYTAMALGLSAASNGYGTIQTIRSAGSAYGNLVINSAGGNVGIGTTTSANKLDVEGGTAIGATYSGTSAAPANGLIVEGNVGIGTTSPASKLELQGTDPYLTLDTTNVQTGLNFQQNGTTKWNLAWNSGSQYLYFWGAGPGTSLVLSDSTGNVGIGTTTPANKLDVEGGTAIGASYSGTSAAPANGLIVEGNVGVGTTSPTAKLHIGGTAGTDGLKFPDGTLQTTASRGITAAAVSVDPPSLASGAGTTLTVTVTGAATGDAVVANPGANLPDGYGITFTRVSAANTVTIGFINGSASSQNPAASTWAIRIIK